VYVAEVQTISTSGFTVNVARLDKLVSKVTPKRLALLLGTPSEQRLCAGAFMLLLLAK
jgi:hypothetical protein